MAIMCGGGSGGYWVYHVGNRDVAPGDPGYNGLTTAVSNGANIDRTWRGSGSPIIFSIGKPGEFLIPLL